MTNLERQTGLLEDVIITPVTTSEVIITPVTTSEAIMTEHVVARSAATQTDPFDILGKFIAFAGLVVLALLAIRIMLMAAGANPNGGFADFIYGISGPMAAPFQGIAGDRSTDGGTFDAAAAIAMPVYALAMVLTMLFVSLLGGSMPSRRETVTRSDHFIQRT